MKIIYMGTPDFAVPSLQAIYDAGHEIPCVVTQPDAVRDRGKKVKFSAVPHNTLSYSSSNLGILLSPPNK